MISVCIATYNGEKFINEQLVSILHQLSENDEIIISDDNSSDLTIKSIETLNDPRIHILHHNPKPAKFTIDYCTHNFENALLHSKGDIIFLADQDDFWLPDKVEVMTEQLRHYDLVMSDCYIGDENLNISNILYSQNRPFSPSIIYNFIKPSFLGCCMAFRRVVLEKALPFPRYGVAHDLWLGCIAYRFFKLEYIRKPLVIYRRHCLAVTTSGTKKRTSLVFKIRNRIYVARALLRLLIHKHSFLVQIHSSHSQSITT